MSNTDTHIELELVDRLHRSDEEAFSILFRQYYEPLCFFAGRYIRDFNTVESLVQGVFVKLWDCREDLHIQASLKSYLYTALRNSCLNHVKHERFSVPLENAESRVDDGTSRPDVQMESDDIARAVQEAIRKLPRKQREILSMAKYDELSYQEIAEIQNISVNTVKTQLKRALRALSESLQYLHVLMFLF